MASDAVTLGTVADAGADWFLRIHGLLADGDGSMAISLAALSTPPEPWASFVERVSFALERANSPDEAAAAWHQLACDDSEPEIHDRALRAIVRLGEPVVRLAVRPRPAPDRSAVLRGHHMRIRAVVELPDGTVLSASDDGTVRRWDLHAGKCTAVLDTGPLRALTSVKGMVVALSTMGNAVELWNVERESRVCQLDDGSGAACWALAVLDATVVAGFFDGSVARWLPDGSLLWRDVFHDGPVRHLVVIPDGRIVSASYDGTVVLVPGAGGPPVVLRDHDHPVRALAAGSGAVCSADDRGTTVIRDADSLEIRAIIRGPERGVHHLCLVPDRGLVIAAFDGALDFVDLRTGARRARLLGHTARVRAITLLDDGNIVTASDDRTLRRWDLSTGREVDRLVGHVGWVRAAIRVVGGDVVSGSADGTLRCWSMTGDRRRPSGHTGWIRALTAASEGHVLSAAEDGTIRLWTVSDGEELATVRAAEAAVRALAHREAYVVTGSDDGDVGFWRVAARAFEAVARVEHAHLKARAVVALAGRLVVSGGSEGFLRAWDLHTGEALSALRLPEKLLGVRTLAAIGPATVAAGMETGTIVAWNVETGETRDVGSHGGRVWASAALHDGRLVTVSFDRTFRVWDTARCVELGRTGGPLGASWAVTAIGDDFLLAASPAGIIRLVDLASLGVVGRAHLRSAAVSICGIEGRDRLAAAVGGDAPAPVMLAVHPPGAKEAMPVPTRVPSDHRRTTDTRRT